jgi:uncharacterized protein YlxW (UPF0749 family)
LEYQEATDEEHARSVHTQIQILSAFQISPALHQLHRYRQLRERLTTLDNQRQSRQRRLDQLQQLRRLLEPFENPQKNIQPNLITKDGELVQELEKMRMLVARVGGRIAQQKTSSGGLETREYSLPGSDQRLEALLNMP